MPTDIRSEDRPYLGRHCMPDTEPAEEQYVPPRWEPAPAAPPPWPAEPSRLLTRQVGEGPTVRIRYQDRPSLPMPLPARHPQAARRWEVRFGQLGQALTALRDWWSQ